MKSKSQVYGYIFLGLLPNFILTWIAIIGAKAGHSPIAFMVGIILPLLAFFCYLGYFKFSKKSDMTNKEIFFTAIRPCIIISIILFVIMSLFCLVYLNDSVPLFNQILEYLRFILLSLLIISLPNFLFQYFIYMLVKQKRINNN